jgi:hypothetical protein
MPKHIAIDFRVARCIFQVSERDRQRGPWDATLRNIEGYENMGVAEIAIRKLMKRRGKASLQIGKPLQASMTSR